MSLSTVLTIAPELAWAITGVVLVFIEIFVPGLVIVFFGGGALITALTTWIHLSNSLPSQLIVFILSSIMLLVLLRNLLKSTFHGESKNADQNQNFNLEIGKVVSVVEFIQPGEVGGKVRYQGTIWSASATEPIAPGESVRITGYHNLTLLVEKAQ